MTIRNLINYKVEVKNTTYDFIYNKNLLFRLEKRTRDLTINLKWEPLLKPAYYSQKIHNNTFFRKRLIT